MCKKNFNLALVVVTLATNGIASCKLGSKVKLKKYCLDHWRQHWNKNTYLKKQLLQLLVHKHNFVAIIIGIYVSMKTIYDTVIEVSLTFY